MVKLVVCYGAPEDPGDFDRHYTETHVPLVHKIPNLQRFEHGKVLGSPDGTAAPYYYLAELSFREFRGLAGRDGEPRGPGSGGARRDVCQRRRDADGRRGLLSASMEITRNSLDSSPGPSDWFTGTVFLDTVATPSEPSRVAAASVHFTPGARTAWHTHPLGQTIWVTEGIGRCQRRGGPVEEIRPGDRVHFERGEHHWHGAAPNRFMTHIAIQEVDETGSTVTWGEHVTDEEYSGGPAL